ncbi:protein canopy homolog 2 [Aplysia californica]|uniref:Protein canopy homolog 2 n=1 Tax=Aplysia californica TaxID=6500 RepID=A0ABM0K6S6_APLCA|nr:protein canopy homolog 2 [Aplysia californica]
MMLGDSAMYLLSFLLLLTFVDVSQCGKNEKYCGVCRALISEANWAVSQVDPKKSIQVGSFRVDPKGDLTVKEKKYARSDSHLEEIFEDICEKLRQYGELTNEDGSKSIVRTSGFWGQRLETTGLNLDREAGKMLKYKCDDFLENHEEEMISLLQRENIPDYEKIICGEETKVCSMEDLASPMITLPEAVDEVNSDNDGEAEEEEEEEEEDDDEEAEKDEL